MPVEINQELLRGIAAAKQVAVLVDGVLRTRLASLVKSTAPVPKEECRAHRTLHWVQYVKPCISALADYRCAGRLP
jgi:hypothetical protein